MEYEFFGVEQQRQLLRERLARMEAEHYDHEINRRIGLELAESENGSQLDEAQRMVAEAERAQAVLESAYRAARSTLDSLGPAGDEPPA